MLLFVQIWLFRGKTNAEGTANDKQHSQIMVDEEWLPVDKPIEEASNERLYRPSCRNDAHVDIGKMAVVHTQEDAALNTKEETALNCKPERIQFS